MNSENPVALVTEKLETIASTEPLQPEDFHNETTEGAACRECSSISSQYLEVDEAFCPSQQSTNTLSSNDNRNGDEERLLSMSLGRDQLFGLKSHPNKLTSVIQRSEAYKEMVMSSSNHMRKMHSNTWSNGTNAGEIVKNPFLQFDMHSKLHHQVDTKSHEGSDAFTKKSSTTRDSTRTSGMSIKMRIKLWNEKDKQAKDQEYRLKKESLQRRSTLFDVGDSGEDYTERIDRSAQSDDEIIKKKPKTVKSDINYISLDSGDPACEVVDEIPRELVRLVRVSPTSSSSSESIQGENLLLAATNNANQKNSPEKKMSGGRKSKAEAKQNKLKWKLINPLSRYKKKSVVESPKQDDDTTRKDVVLKYKRPHTKKRAVRANKENEDVSADDVVSPSPVCLLGTIFDEEVCSIEDKDVCSIEDKETCSIADEEILDKLPSMFESKSSSDIAPTSGNNRSVAHDIRSIINSLGTADVSLREKACNGREPTRMTSMDGNGRESPCSAIAYDDGTEPLCTICVDDDSNESDGSTDDEEDEEDVANESSLDFQCIGRQDRKRRVRQSGFAMRNSHLIIDGKISLPPYHQNSENVIATSLMHGDAVWDLVAIEPDDLSFSVGDEVEILDMTDDMWWYGNVRDSFGWFPASFVRLRVCQDDEDEDVSVPPNNVKSCGASTESSEVVSLRQRHPPQPTADLEPTRATSEECSDTVMPMLKKSFSIQQGGHGNRRMTIRRKDSMSSIPSQKLTPKEIRGKIVEEILNTEKAYVQHLEDIVEGYLKRCREYPMLFDKEQIELIFSNVEEVYQFQRDFLQELQARVNRGCLEQSQIGEIFVVNQHEFRIYSQYCNNHPNAVNEMNLLEGKEQYALFFESCRLLRNLQDISLGGFLLTPVQKICKYPLQLSELLKYTSEDHPDYQQVVAAQMAMKNVAMLINEQKRRIENMGKIGRWQKTIDGWKGPDLLETSSEMIHSGELQKISKGHSQERFFFLFDHQLIYCRKDTIGGKLGFKGRLNLDLCQIDDRPDGSVLHGNTPIKNGWMMNNTAKDNKSYIIYAKNPQIKEEWMQAFEKERQRVKEDNEKGFSVSMKMKKAAVSLCASSSESRARRRSVHRRHAAVSESFDTVVKQKVENNGKKMSSPAVLAQATIPSAAKKSNKSRKKKMNSVI